MSKLQFGDVRILVVDPNVGARDSVRTILNNHGFRAISVGAGLEDLNKGVADTTLDLLISDCDLTDGNFCRLVHSMRHHDVGSNPFLPIIALSSEPTPTLVKKVIDAGVDDLLPKPISTGHLLKRIQTLVKSRKPFVVTSNYIGPDRRKASQRGEKSDIPLVEVPNVLKAKISGVADEDAMAQSIADAVAEVNLQKLERYAVQIGILVEMILPTYAEGRIDGTLEDNLNRLNYVAQDTSRRLVGTKYDHISELCQNLISVAGDIRARKETPLEKDLQLLTPLSQAIQNAFNVKEDVAALARRISASVNQDQERKKA